MSLASLTACDFKVQESFSQTPGVQAGDLLIFSVLQCHLFLFFPQKNHLFILACWTAKEKEATWLSK